MKLEKLFGSGTKTDILKYFLFRRQWVSLRSLETSIDRTFPAIKKQIDSLEEAGIVDIDKTHNKRSITLKEKATKPLKNLFLFALQQEIYTILQQYLSSIDTYYFGELFGYNIPMDLVLLYHDLSDTDIKDLKQSIAKKCMEYFITSISITCMTQKERDQRYRLADKFVLSIMKGLDGQV